MFASGTANLPPVKIPAHPAPPVSVAEPGTRAMEEVTGRMWLTKSAAAWLTVVVTIKNEKKLL